MESEKGIEVDVVMAIKEYEGICNRWEVPAHGHQYVVVEDAVGMNKKKCPNAGLDWEAKNENISNFYCYPGRESNQ